PQEAPARRTLGTGPARRRGWGYLPGRVRLRRPLRRGFRPTGHGRPLVTTGPGTFPGGRDHRPPHRSGGRPRPPRPGPSSGTATPPTQQSTDRRHTPDQAPVVPELDHGTGEHEAMPPRAHEEEDHGPEWNEHMSVLDQHLIKADTPAPPRPKFADTRPTTEQDHQGEDPAEWFEDGKERHPDQPKVGDRGNPVIPARELRQEREPVAEQADTPAKPPTQLDHGTAELVTFVEVRKDTSPTDRATPAEEEHAPSVPRRTVADLERAEAQALERRRAGRSGAQAF